MVTASSLPTLGHAEIPPVSAEPAKLAAPSHASVARQLLSRIAKKFDEVDHNRMVTADPSAFSASAFADGEELFMQVEVRNSYALDAPVLTRVHNQGFLVSLRDFLLVAQYPIEVNIPAGTASGEYSKGKNFSMNIQNRIITAGKESYAFSPQVQVIENDVLVPVSELGRWLDLKMRIDTGSLTLIIEDTGKLPAELRLIAKNRGKTPGLGDPIHPKLKDENAARAVPLLDVSTDVSYKKHGDNNRYKDEDGLAGNAYIRTSGDIAGGTLNTQMSLNDQDYLTSLRATFVEQSLEPELLGPLKARRVELGDVYAPTMQLRSGIYSGVGARISNVSPDRRTLSPSTDIRGTSFPNWDVELYRDDHLMDVVTVGDDGVYAFENVDLFGSNNNFRVVMYGPQGERREEEIVIPVDNRRLSNQEAVYDISVVAQQKQLYRKHELHDDEDLGNPALVAKYEMPVGDFTAVTAGVESGQKKGKPIHVAHSGISTVAGGTLLNLDAAVDNNLEPAAQLVARRDFGKHKLRNDTKVSSEKFAVTDDNGAVPSVFSNTLSLNGPLDLGLRTKPTYTVSGTYSINNRDDATKLFRAGLSSSLFNRFTAGQQFIYKEEPYIGNSIDGISTLTGRLGKNHLRLVANYEIDPDTELNNLQARLTRPLADDIDFNLDVNHKPNPKLTEGTAQINWRAGFADISPSVTYNSNKDVIAMLNTRFGLAHDPLSKNIKTFDENITSNGGMSAFVYLDKNGDNIFNEGDEPIRDAIIKAPQNGGEEITDEKGHVFFSRLVNMRPTDIYVDDGSLPDPFWVSSYDGFSVVPREGHIVKVEFPVHVGGEIEGSVYARTVDNDVKAQRGIMISLYDLKGKKIKTVASESDGYYLIQKVQPGRYMLVVDNKTFDGNYARPKPQPILIKTTGTVMNANHIYLQENGADVPVKFYANAEDLKIDPSTLHGRSMFLNLGSYKSRLTMGLSWLKIRQKFKRELGNMEIMELPSESNPDKTEFYTLRVLAYSDDMTDAYNKCKVLTSNGQVCTVEVVPENGPSKVATQ